jgi:NADH:ubiquinone reductase (H+-translocating)
MKKKILIIGCGFAGCFAGYFLSRHKKDLEVTMIDRKETLDFLPMLPDVVGRGIDPEFLTYPINTLTSRLGVTFINDEVKSIDLNNNMVITSRNSLGYDYLLISSGSETNFYGNDQIRKYSYKLDSAADIKTITAAISKKGFASYIISGGGYTGVEIASGLRMFLNEKSLHKKIIIVERAASILGPLPEWMKEYTLNNLKNNLGINIITNTVVDTVAEEKVILSNGQTFEPAMLIWVAGVRTADFIQNLNLEKNPQGRIKVDEYLKIKDNCFIAGDCAYIHHGDGYLRMAVQFAIYQSLTAASNIISSIRGGRLRRYQPIDLGYIIPMANNRSCGQVMGMNVKGAAATALHFLMCIYRSPGLRNKLGVINNLIAPSRLPK